MIRLEEEDQSMYSSYWYTRMECRCYSIYKNEFGANIDSSLSPYLPTWGFPGTTGSSGSSAGKAQAVSRSIVISGLLPAKTADRGRTDLRQTVSAAARVGKLRGAGSVQKSHSKISTVLVGPQEWFTYQNLQDFTRKTAGLGSRGSFGQRSEVVQ